MDILYTIRGKPKTCQHCGETLVYTVEPSLQVNKMGTPLKYFHKVACVNYNSFTPNSHDIYLWINELEREDI